MTSQDIKKPENTKASKNSGKQLAKATGVVAFSTLISRILGLLRDSVTASYFGAGMVSDAFFVAFRIPNLLRRLVAEGSLATAFVPVFTDELVKSEEAGKQAADAVRCFSLILTVILTLLGIYFAEDLTLIFAPGFGAGSEKTNLSIHFLQIMFPYIILVSLLALESSLLNSLGFFAWPAFAPAILNIVIILGVVFGHTWFEVPITSLAWSVVLGGFVCLLPQIYALKKLGFPFAFSSPFQSLAVRKLIILMLPSFISASVYQITIFLNTLLASMLEEGSVTWMYYADRLFQFPLGVFSMAIATAILPTLSRLISNNEHQRFSATLLSAIDWVSFITLPAMVGLIVLADPIISVLFEYGSFTHYDAQQSARVLQGFSLGLWSISAQAVLVRAYLAKKNTRIPSLISVFTLLINTVFAMSLMGPGTQTPDSALASAISACVASLHWTSLGSTGLALAGSLSSLFSFTLLALYLNKLQISLSLLQLLTTTIRPLLASIGMALLLPYLMFSGQDILTLIVAIPVATLVYFALCLGLKYQPAYEVLKSIKKFL